MISSVLVFYLVKFSNLRHDLIQSDHIEKSLFKWVNFSNWTYLTMISGWSILRLTNLNSIFKIVTLTNLKNKTLEIIYRVDQINQLKFLSKWPTWKLKIMKNFQVIIWENWPTWKIIKLVNFPKLSTWYFSNDLGFSNWSFWKKMQVGQFDEIDKWLAVFHFSS